MQFCLLEGRRAGQIRKKGFSKRLISVLLARCLCGHCEAMASAVDSMCCREVDAYWALVQDLVPATDITCLTLHPGFDACCLNQFSLQVAYLNFRQEHGALHASRAEYVYTRLIYNTIILPYYYPPYTNTCQVSTQLTNCQQISI